jgi:hypothetical protein
MRLPCTVPENQFSLLATARDPPARNPRTFRRVSALVSTLLNVDPGGGRYVFALITWNEFADAVRDELNRQAQAFGLDLGPAGTLVQPFPQRMYEVAEEVLAKPWPTEVRRRFDDEQEPIIVIFDKGWQEFDPTEDPYAVIWLSDFHGDPAQVRSLLGELSRRTRKGEDVIAYLLDVARRARRDAAITDAERGAGMLARLASYFEIKPHLFGVAVDVKAILRDIAERRAGRS